MILNLSQSSFSKYLLSLFILGIFLWTLSTPLYGQIPGLKTYTELDGFPGSTGYLISQDQRGFIWVGSNNGVARFDGRSFEVFDTDDGLQDKEILVTIPSGDSSVLFSALLNNFAYYKDGEVHAFDEKPGFNALHNEHLNNAFLDKTTGSTWLSDDYNEGLVYRFSQGRLEQIEIDIQEPFFIEQVFDNKLFIQLFNPGQVSKCRLGIYDLLTNEYWPICNGNVEPGSFSATTCNSSGTYAALMLKDQRTIAVYSIEDYQRMEPLAEYSSDKVISQVFFDDYDQLWLLFNKGGFAYCGKAGTNLQKSPPIVLLPNYTINHVFVDRDKNIWITTRANGLLYISEKHWISARTLSQLDLPNYSPWALATIGDDAVLVSYHKSSIISKISRQQSRPLLDGGPLVKGFRCILPFADGLVLGSQNGLEISWYTKSGFEKNPKNVPQYSTLKDISFDGNGNILAASHQNAIRVHINRDQQKFEQLEILFEGRTTCIEEVSNGILLVGTPNGLYKSYKGCGPWTTTSKSLSENIHVTDLFEFRRGTVLVGTNTRGLFSYTIDKDVAKPLLKEGPLQNACVHQIYQHDNVLWLATDKGIFQLLQNSNGEINNYHQLTFFDGLPSNDVSSICIMHDTLYAATAMGMGIFPKKSLLEPNSKPVTIWINRASFGDSVVHFPKRLSLDYPNTDVKLSLSTIAFKTFGQLGYQFRIKGLGNRWIATEGTDIHLNYLPPGQHQLEITPLDKTGVLNNSTRVTLSIDVLPAFWQTWWFRTLAWLSGILVITLIARLWTTSYKRKLHKKTQQKKRLATLELEAIKAQINPHFISNCLNSVQYLHLKKQYEEASRYLDLFAKLIHQTMQYSQETFIPIQDEVDYLHNYLELEKMRFKENLHYEITVDNEVNAEQLIPAMMLQPYVENSVKHGIPELPDRGEIRVQFLNAGEGRIRVLIKDSGSEKRTSSEARERKPLGFRLSQDRVEAYKQLFQLDIEVSIKKNENSELPYQGTEVDLLIHPIGHAESLV